ncbi:Peptidoglycan-binding Lysin subgroup [Penicillium expansum]|uniref:Secreted LysM effector LysM2 n=1 Tax=Penicillium expansum TaxID=27334 RepID=LYSM2_PENEN|nr:Peptidoglycan-binding Lysin subgroup [Penicillium expansum]KGO58766.1 Peptidoglycan-binding Lysin subgroup [Penicillium expansum]
MMAPKSLQTGLLILLLAKLKLAWGMTLVPRQVTCDYEAAASSGDTCTSFAAEWGLTEETFASLNPSAACPSLVAGQNYCMVGTISAASTTSSSSSTTSSSTTSSSTTSSSTTSSSTTTSSFTTTTASETTSTAANGVTTPMPVQSGMIDSCSKFDLIKSGDTCASIASTYNIDLSSFYSWNPAVGSSCAYLDVGYYVCVDAVPSPVQSGITESCSKFDLVESGDTCASIVSTYNIPLSSFYAWNPAVGSSCAYLDLGYYVCVGTDSSTVATSTTSAGNGITTPTPDEPGMVSDCTKFWLVGSDDTCTSIASSEDITVADIEKWNPKVGSTCTDVWLGDYICVGV